MRFILAVFLICTCIDAQVPELLYLKFNEGTGTATANDALLGMPGVNPLLSTSSFAWWGGSALGPFCMVQYPSGPQMSLQAPLAVTGDWSIEFWWQQANVSNGKSVFRDLSAGGFDLKVNGSNFVYPEDLRLLGSFGELVISDAVETSTWVHVAIVNDTLLGLMTPYVDGVPGMPWVPTGSTDLIGVAPGSFEFPAQANALMDEFRIWDRALSQAEIQAGMNTELSTATLDLLVSQIRSPVFLPHATRIFGSSEVVSCEILNAGTTTIAAGTSLTMTHTVVGGSTIIETWNLPQALAPGDKLPFTFQATADLSAPGPQSLEVAVQMAGDLHPANDVRRLDYGGDQGFLINSFPWSEDFESMPGKNGSILGRMPHWLQENEPGGTGVNDAWAFADVSPANLPRDIAMYSAGAGNSPAFVAVRGPLLDLRGVANPRLRFQIKSDGTSSAWICAMSIDVVMQPSGVIVSDVYGPIGDLGAGWHEVQVDLSAFSGQVVNLRFRVVSPLPPGGSLNYVTNLVYVDDLLLTDHPFDIGQAALPGLALFDLNSALNIGMNGPSYGEPGPYYSSAFPGDSLAFSFEGAPGQPILLLAGPLNPVAATFPNIGQLDIGGPIDPTTGIPTGLSVIFDGNQPGALNGFFVTDPSGQSSFGLPLPPLPPGVLATFQAVLRDPATGLFLIANAVELSVN